MCGLVGFFGIPNKNRLDAFHDMLQFDVVRGRHSTGVAGIKLKKIDIVKAAVLPQQLMDTEEYDKKIDTIENFCLLGHNRFATKGEVSDQNAHPFRHKHITLAHNGTLWNHESLPDGKNFKVDSEAMTYAIANLGIKEAWKKFNGAAAITYWDSKDGSLNIASNGKRSLFFGFLQNRDGVMWSSEPWTVRAAMMRNHLSLDEGVMEAPDDNVLYTFWYDKKSQKMQLDTTKLQKWEYVYDNDEWRTRHSHHTAYDQCRLPAPRNNNVIDLRVTPKEENKTQHAPFTPVSQTNSASSTNISRPGSSQIGMNDDPYQRTEVRKKDISEGEFHTRYKQCMHCAESLEFEFEESVIIDNDHAVCNDCFETAEAYGMSLV